MSRKYPYQNLSLKDMKGEVWEDILFLDGAYRISNFGRVNALRRWIERAHNRNFWSKEKILASFVHIQNVSGGKRQLKRLVVPVTFEKKKYTIPVARMVFYLFVKKFNLDDRKLFVSCKDEDPLNICIQNLVLTNPSATITRAYQKKHRYRDCFGKSVSQLTQYDLTGKRINIYPSLSSAAKAYGISSSSISKALKKKDGCRSGCIWRKGIGREQLSRIPASVTKMIESKKLHNTVVTQYDITGKKIKEHINIKAAARAVNTHPNWIKRVVEGKAFSSKSFYWKLGRGHAQKDMQLMLNKINHYRSVSEAACATNNKAMNIHYALKFKEGVRKEFIWKIGWGQPKINTKTILK